MPKQSIIMAEIEKGLAGFWLPIHAFFRSLNCTNNYLSNRNLQN